MKTLFVLRHGQANPESVTDSDYARELTLRGLSEARLAAEALLQRATTPSLILSSSAARARQTADVCLKVLAGGAELVIADDLYLAEPQTCLAALRRRGDPHAAVVLIGHNPGLEALVHVLTARSEHLATASLVEIALPIATWAALGGPGAGGGLVVSTFRP